MSCQAMSILPIPKRTWLIVTFFDINIDNMMKIESSDSYKNVPEIGMHQIQYRQVQVV